MSPKPVATAVLGASGYGGGEMLRLISAHPELELVAAGAHRQAGAPIAAMHPHLVDGSGRLAGGIDTFRGNDDPALAAADLVFMALPHGQSAALSEKLAEVPVLVDLGADHRLRDRLAWDRYYGQTEPGDPWTYGLPELPGQREKIVASKRVANPGCYATAIQVGLAPLAAAGMLAAEPIAVVAASGTSGAGRALAAHLIATEVMGSMTAYKAGGAHQHIPEVEQQLAELAGRPIQLAMTPLLAPMPRGIIATCIARLDSGLSPAGSDQEALRQTLACAYDQEPFITLLPAGVWPTTKSVAGSNQIRLQLTVDRRTKTVTVVSVLDNLVKGAAGQAIQNANLMLGLAEGTGLSHLGFAP